MLFRQVISDEEIEVLKRLATPRVSPIHIHKNACRPHMMCRISSCAVQPCRTQRRASWNWPPIGSAKPPGWKAKRQGKFSYIKQTKILLTRECPLLTMDVVWQTKIKKFGFKKIIKIHKNTARCTSILPKILTDLWADEHGQNDYFLIKKNRFHFSMINLRKVIKSGQRWP